MKHMNFAKNFVVILFIHAWFLGFFPGKGMGAEVYEYQRQDKAEEQDKYIAKLEEDKKKIQMAIDNTKRLIDKSRSRHYLPELYLRLAELFIEESRVAYFLRKSQGSGSTSALDQIEANALKNQAIEIYQRIVEHFPTFADRDKVHFFMAHEYRELGQIDEMIKQYRAIITQFKDSAYVPEAYLLLGDYFISQQDIEMSKRHYEAVLKFPQSPAASIARYKLAWCYINIADYKSAIKLFEEAVSTASSSNDLDIDTYKRVDIRQEALVDMAFCYTECYGGKTPQEALAYFQKFAWSRQVYMVVLEKLANRYMLKKKWHHAAVIYRQLSILEHDAEKLLEYSRNIFECSQALGTYKDAAQDLAIIIKALRKQKYSTHITDADKGKNLKDYELYARDLATHLHNKARQAKSVSDFARAADAYKLYVEFFDRSPVLDEIASNFAEALFSSGRYLEAGRQYEKLADDSSQKGKERQDKLYSAVISYYTAIKHKEDLNYYEVAFARDGLKTTGKMYAQDFPDSKHVPDVLFNVAWISYDAGNYDEAVQAFSSFVAAYPKGKPASAAIHLILDSFHLKEDYEGLINYGKEIINNRDITDSKLKREVTQIVEATESKVVSSLTVAAMEDWEKGKSGLIDFAKQSASSTGEQALTALLVSSKEKGDLKTLLNAGENLVYKYPESAGIEDTLGVMIDTSLRTAQFRLVAEYLETFAEKMPTHSNTKEFLYQVGCIRKDLGQYGLSNRDFQEVLKRSDGDVKMREEVIFAMSENSNRMSDINAARRVLSENRQYLSRAGKIRADAGIADLYFQKGEFKDALKFRKRAYESYNPKQGKKDDRLRTAMAQMVYNAVDHQKGKYMSVQLKGRIDNKVVADKARQLEELEKGYQSVMQYQSPAWALRACFGSYEVNSEFARFLEESPLPELTPEQRSEYVRIISQKADGYKQKADQYLKTCIEQAHKWEVCDPMLAQYFIMPVGKEGKGAKFDSFAGSCSSVEIGIGCLKDHELRGLHYRLMQEADNLDVLAALSEAYIKKGDFRQALIIAQKTLSEANAEKGSLKARLYNDLGLSHLYIGNDSLAKDAFKKALAMDPGNIGAMVNLAGLFTYYGHKTKASQIYDVLAGNDKVAEATDMIHPHARELYDVQIRDSKK
jgi:tetratricopeptide (TPR) repeat protein